MKSIPKTSTQQLTSSFEAVTSSLTDVSTLGDVFPEFQQRKTHVRFLERRGHGRQKHGEMHGTELIADPFNNAFIAASVTCLSVSDCDVHFLSHNLCYSLTLWNLQGATELSAHVKCTKSYIMIALRNAFSNNTKELCSVTIHLNRVSVGVGVVYLAGDRTSDILSFTLRTKLREESYSSPRDPQHEFSNSLRIECYEVASEAWM